MRIRAHGFSGIVGLFFFMIGVLGVGTGSDAHAADATHDPQPFTVEDLDRLVRNPESNRSIESVMEHLPPEFKSNFTFVYKSRSPFKKDINPQNPRVILFNDTTKLVLTFIGKLSSLEVFQ